MEIKATKHEKWKLKMILEDFISIASKDNDFVPFAQKVVGDLEDALIGYEDDVIYEHT